MVRSNGYLQTAMIDSLAEGRYRQLPLHITSHMMILFTAL